MGNIMSKLMGAPSERKQRAASMAEQNNRPARSANETKESDATVLEQDVSEVDTAGTDVSVVRAKKTSRKGVPGLGL